MCRRVIGVEKGLMPLFQHRRYGGSGKLVVIQPAPHGKIELHATTPWFWRNLTAPRGAGWYWYPAPESNGVGWAYSATQPATGMGVEGPGNAGGPVLAPMALTEH